MTWLKSLILICHLPEPINSVPRQSSKVQSFQDLCHHVLKQKWHSTECKFISYIEKEEKKKPQSDYTRLKSSKFGTVLIF